MILRNKTFSLRKMSLRYLEVLLMFSEGKSMLPIFASVVSPASCYVHEMQVFFQEEFYWKLENLSHSSNFFSPTLL